MLKFGELFERGEIFSKQSEVYAGEHELLAEISKRPFLSIGGKERIIKTDTSLHMLFKEAPFLLRQDRRLVKGPEQA